MISRGFRYRLYPTEEQGQKLLQWAGVVRLVYNLALEQREKWRLQYRAATGRSFNFASQGLEVTHLRREFDWIGAVPSNCLTQALRDLDHAYANFFAGRARFPSYRRRAVNDTMRFQAKVIGVRVINRRWSAVRLPNLGWVKFRRTREIAGMMKNATISAGVDGWHIAFACEIGHEAPANVAPGVGIDRGVSVSVALSNGETFHMPASIAHLDKRRRAAQRVLSRRKKGSNRRRKQLRRVARISARITRVRADWQHRVSRSIADRFGLVAIEKLNVSGMSSAGPGKHGLNRAIREQGWTAFATKLGYKLEERGGTLELVDPRYTSQACSACGVIDADSRKTQAAFVCTSCGFALNADHNAAINILRRSTSAMLVEGRGYAPVEARTCLEAA